MIKKSENINERKLTKFMGGYKDIINLEEDGFEYCNGYILVNLTYENDIAIQKLFSIGAIKNYKKWEPTQSRDLSDVQKFDEEITAEQTPYLFQIKNKEIAYIFKADGKYYYYNKDYVDIFTNVTFKVGVNKEAELPILEAYAEEKLIGLVMPVRVINTDSFLDIVG